MCLEMNEKISVTTSLFMTLVKVLHQKVVLYTYKDQNKVSFIHDCSLFSFRFQIMIDVPSENAFLFVTLSPRVFRNKITL